MPPPVVSPSRHFLLLTLTPPRYPPGQLDAFADYLIPVAAPAYGIDRPGLLNRPRHPGLIPGAVSPAFTANNVPLIR